MMKQLKYGLLMLLMLGAAGMSTADESGEPVTVIELFTSQGCYSCPPADELLGELDRQANTITLSCHVTYWNYLGWRDTFSQSFCDNRQRAYQSQSALKGNQGVYTPQMVINGRYGAVGSREKTIEQAIRILKKEDQIQPIAISFKDKQQLTIELPPMATAQTHQLFLLGTTGTHLVPIPHGENGGKKLSYHNPVEYVKNLGPWEGESISLEQVVQSNKAIKEWIVLAQTWPIGEIVAAGQLIVE